MISSYYKKTFSIPDSGESYPGKKETLFINNKDLHLGTRLIVDSLEIKNIKTGEDVWIIKFRDQKKYEKCILVSNREYVAWISSEEFIIP